MSDTDSTTEVEYRPIPGFPGYRAGSDGSIWSCWGKGYHGRQGGVWRRMIPSSNGSKYGHVAVTLVRESVPFKRYIHRLIAEVFISSIPDGMDVCHNDGNPSNNVPSNLRIDTRLGNLADRVKHGTINCGERQGHVKLTNAIVLAIRADYAAGGVTYYDLAARHGVDHSTVYAVVKRKTWKHI